LFGDSFEHPLDIPNLRILSRLGRSGEQIPGDTAISLVNRDFAVDLFHDLATEPGRLGTGDTWGREQRERGLEQGKPIADVRGGPRQTEYLLELIARARHGCQRLERHLRRADQRDLEWRRRRTSLQSRDG